MSDEVRDILSEIGYNLRDCGKEYRTKPLYRDSDNPNVLCIQKETGVWFDFKTSKHGSLEDLVQITLKLKDISDAKDFINKNFTFERKQVVKEKIRDRKLFNKKNLDSINKDDTYWNNRGISSKTLSNFQCGVMTSGKMPNRYVFPIFDKMDNLVGVAGRDITEKHQMKWKLLGDKKYWIYPFKYNKDYIKEKGSVFLIESIGDMLALWEAGIKNTLVLFGLTASPKIKSILISLGVKKIHICLNNDSNNSDAGNQAAEKIQSQLLNFFDDHQVSINLPPKNDFGCMATSEILTWQKQIKA
jgi:hypothetical protein